MNRKNLWIGKIGFNAMTQRELVDQIENLHVENESAYVTFSGVAAIVAAEDSCEVERVQNEATICAVDGMPVNWIANMRGIKSERCSGPDIMEQIIKEGVAKHRKHYFYGSTEEVLCKLKVNLEKRYPCIEIVGMYAPPFRKLNEKEDQNIVDIINAAEPDYVWVGLGAPKQDIWMWSHRYAILNCRLLGVGAAFNFLAGTVKRAPIFYQKCGLEWLYRLLQEPRHLWRRYTLGGLKFLWIIIKEIKYFFCDR